MKIQVWAYRGASAYAPENTIPAFEMAVEMHADAVELEVQLSKDNELVVAHDETLERVSDGTGAIIDHTLKELRSLNFNKTHLEFKKVQIPTLEEVYELLRPTGLIINVELRTRKVPYPGIEEKVLNSTEQYGLEDRVIYSSFRHATLRRIRMMQPEARTGILYSDGWMGVAPYARDTVLSNALHPAKFLIEGRDYVKTAHQYGLMVHTWLVDSKEEMRTYRDFGVDAIMTKKPDVCRNVVDEI